MILLLAYYLLWCTNIIFVLLNKNSKRLVLITWLLLFAIFAGSDAQIGDAFKYRTGYELGVLDANWPESGYSLLMTFCKLVGFTQYNELLVVLFLFGSILSYVGIRKLKSNCHILLAATMGFIFPSLSTAVRYYIAVSFFIFALPYLLDRTIVFLLICLIAINFHKSSIFLLVFSIGTVALISRDKLKIRKVLLFLFILLTTSIIIYVYYYQEFPWQNQLYSILNAIHVPANKIDSYLRTRTQYGWILLVLIYIVNLVFFAITERACKKIHDINIRKVILIAFMINVLSLLFMPFARFNLVFFRLMIYQTIANSLLFGTIVSSGRNMLSKDYNCINSIPVKLSFLSIIFAWSLLSLYDVNSITISNIIINTLWVE